MSAFSSYSAPKNCLIAAVVTVDGSLTNGLDVATRAECPSAGALDDNGMDMRIVPPCEQCIRYALDHGDVESIQRFRPVEQDMPGRARQLLRRCR